MSLITAGLKFIARTANVRAMNFKPAVIRLIWHTAKGIT